MADVFISYARSDQELVERLSLRIEQEGFTVWWDSALVAGSQFSAQIERELANASAVIVVWSTSSLKSTWVRNEADFAAKREVLIPIFAERIEPPLPHRLLHTLDFSSWSGSENDDCLSKLRRALTLLRLRSRAVFERAAVARVEGRVDAADKLLEILRVGGQCAQYALLELCYHELARLGDHAALAVLVGYRRQAIDPFVSYAMDLMISICRLAAGAAPHSIAELSDSGSSLELPLHQRMMVALHEIVAFGALNKVDKLEEAWAALIRSKVSVPAGAISHPRLDDVRAYDRTVLSILYGDQDVETVVRQLPQPQLRGLVHQAAINCCAARKSSPYLTHIVNRAEQDGWKRQTTVTQLRRRLRGFERALLPSAGTLFPPTGRDTP